MVKFAALKSFLLSNLITRSIAGIVFSVVVVCSALLGAEAMGLLFLFLPQSVFTSFILCVSPQKVLILANGAE